MSFLIFIHKGFVQDFHWTIGETEVRIQTEVLEKAGPRWPFLGLGRTKGVGRPRGGPTGPVFSVCGSSCSCLLCLMRAAPTLDFYLRSYSKYMETKQNSTGFENRGVIFIEFINYGGTLHLKGKYLTK